MPDTDSDEEISIYEDADDDLVIPKEELKQIFLPKQKLSHFISVHKTVKAIRFACYLVYVEESARYKREDDIIKDFIECLTNYEFNYNPTTKVFTPEELALPKFKREVYPYFEKLLVDLDEKRHRFISKQFRPYIMSEQFKKDFKEATIKLNSLVIKPETFNGYKPRPRDWWENYLEAISANGWSEVVAIKYFSTFLSESARDWYSTELRPQIEKAEITTIAILESLFKKNYLGDADYKSLCRYLATIKQKPEEKISTFLPKMRKILLQVDSKMSEKEQVRQISDRLRPEYQMDLARFESDTIDKLRDVCMKVEAGLAAQRNVSSNARTVSPTRRAGSNKKRRSPPRQFSNQDKPTERNFNRPGSYNKQPRSQSRPKSRQSSERSPPTQKKGIVCYKCDRPNHYASDCRATKKADGSPITPYQPKKVATIRETNGETTPKQVDEPQVLTISKKCFSVKQPELKANLLINSNTEHLMTHNFVCNHKKVEGTIDTGSQVTVIDEQFALVNGWEITPPGSNLIGANGSKLESPGATQIRISLTIGKTTKTKTHTVPVVRNLSTKLLIGLDIMKEYKICINPIERKIFYQRESTSPGIRTISETKMPPRSQLIIPARVNTISHGTVLTIPFEGSHQLLIANNITEVKDNQCEILVCNPSNKEITVQANVQLATYQEVEKENNKNNQSTINLVHQLGNTNDFVNIADNLDSNQTKELIILLNDNKKAFSIDGRIGLTSLAEHKIELLPEAKPHAERLRRRALVDIQECQRQIKELLTKDYIEESKSPWSSAYVLAKKKNGEKRLCIDFRKLNDVTKKAIYPLPNIDDCLDSLAGKRYFSQLDMASGFWQIPMNEESKEYTAFSTEDGHYQFKRMPFGLTNAPASFQRMVNALFAGLKGINLQVFIDDICIATETWPEHLLMLKKVFSIVTEANLTLKGEKCLFGANKIIFLGHEISGEGIKQDPAKLISIQKLSAPTDKDGVRRFLGMSGYYRKFVPNFAIIAEPLTRLIRKSNDFVWKDEQQAAFKAIIDTLSQNATLAHFNHTDPLMLKTDASKVGVAGILLQQQQGDWKIITCCSRRLTESEENYGITDLEGLAIVYSVQKLRPYLLGKQFEILTDHSALTVLKTRMPSSARLRRWALILSEFNFTIKYTKGKLHEDVDCLSRAPVLDENDNYLDGVVYSIQIPRDVDRWKLDYQGDESSGIFQDAVAERNHYKFREGIIYFKDKLYVPESKRQQLVVEAHETCSHGGVRVTAHQLKKFHWPDMDEDIKLIVQSCHSCQARKADRTGPTGRMFHHEVYEPLQLVAIDEWHTNKETHKHNKVILTAIDTFTRFLYAKAIQKLTAAEAAYFMNEFVGIFGAPISILTDGAGDFASVIVRETLDAHGIKHVLATPGHSQSNAVVERAIQTLQDRLAAKTLNYTNSSDWDDLLPATVLGINTSYHESTKYTPYELMFGREMTWRSDLVTENPDPKDAYAKMLKDHLRIVRQDARSNVQRAQQASRPRYEETRRDVQYEIGDKVLSRHTSRRENSKTGERYVGPFEVVAKDNDVYKVRNLRTKKTVERHVSSLKAYREAAIRPWQQINLTMCLATLTLCCMPFTTADPIINTHDNLLGNSTSVREYDEEPSIIYQAVDKYVEESRKIIQLTIGIGDIRAKFDTLGSALHSIPPAPSYKNPLGRPDWNDFCDDTALQCYQVLRSRRDSVEHCQYVYSLLKGNEQHQSTLTNDMRNKYESHRPPFGLSIGWGIIDPAFLKRLQHVEAVVKEKYNLFIETLIQYKNTEMITEDIYQSGIQQTNARARRDIADEIKNLALQTGKSILGQGLAMAGGTLAINIGYDLVKATIEYFNPDSNTNRITALQDQVNTLHNSQTLITEVLERMLEVQSKTVTQLQYGIEKIQSQLDNEKIFNLLQFDLLRLMDKAIDNLRRLTIAKVQGKVDVQALVDMFNLSDLLSYDSASMKLIHSHVEVGAQKDGESKPYVLHMRFSVHKVSKDTRIAKIFAFPHWNLEKHPAEFVAYEGPDMIVFNTSSHCVKHLNTQQVGRMLHEKCKEKNHIDHKLLQWTTLKTSYDPRLEPQQPTEYHSTRYSLIYCFGHNITIRDQKSICPAKVIRLPVTLPYEIEGYDKWEPTTQDQSMNLAIEADVFEEIHADHRQNNQLSMSHGHAPTEVMLIEARLKLDEAKRELQALAETKISVDKGLLHRTMEAVAALSILGVLIVVIYYISVAQCTKNLYSLLTQPQLEQPLELSRRLSTQSTRPLTKKHMRGEENVQLNQTADLQIESAEEDIFNCSTITNARGASNQVPVIKLSMSSDSTINP